MEVLAGGFMTVALGWMAWVSREILTLKFEVQELRGSVRKTKRKQ